MENNMEKTYDLLKLYIAPIAKQTEVQRKYPSQYDISGKIEYQWGYEPLDGEEQIYRGVFVKTLKGYKRLSTGEIYNVPTKFTAGKTVIVESQMERFLENDMDLGRHLIQLYHSRKIPLEAMETIEKHINGDQQYIIHEEVDFSL